ncbi:MAG: type 4a pilus biogenesis protein PilO [Patescibacteria group bacterium]|nr:type 4a pilus biogenesis protein PilO [Patescibacteria group bacterium]
MNKQKIIIEILFFLIGILALYFGIYKGSMLVLNSGKTLGEEQDSLVRWQNRQAIVQELNNKVKDLTFKDELHLAIPVDQKTGDFLKIVQGAAQNAGVSIRNFAPSDNSIETMTTIEAVNQDIVRPAQMASYSVDMTVNGTYEKIYQFLNNLEKVKRVMQIKQVDVAKTGADDLTVNLNLVVYYLKN